MQHVKLEISLRPLRRLCTLHLRVGERRYFILFWYPPTSWYVWQSDDGPQIGGMDLKIGQDVAYQGP